VKDRLAPFFGNCAPAAWRQRVLFGDAARPRRDGAKPCHHTNRTSVSVDPGGIGFRGGRMRRRLVRSNLPSGLLTAQGIAGATQATFCRLPRRLGGQIGGCHRLLPSTPGGWFPVKGIDGKSSQLCVASLGFCLPLLLKESSKTALGCLTYSRIWYLSRDKHNLL